MKKGHEIIQDIRKGQGMWDASPDASDSSHTVGQVPASPDITYKMPMLGLNSQPEQVTGI